MARRKQQIIGRRINKHLVWITLLAAIVLDVLGIDAATIIASSASIFAYTTGYMTYNPNLHNQKEDESNE